MLRQYKVFWAGLVSSQPSRFLVPAPSRHRHGGAYFVRGDSVGSGSHSSLSVMLSLLGGDRRVHVEALQWLNCICTRRLRANCHQLYELGNAKRRLCPCNEIICWGVLWLNGTILGVSCWDREGRKTVTPKIVPFTCFCDCRGHKQIRSPHIYIYIYIYI